MANPPTITAESILHALSWSVANATLHDRLRLKRGTGPKKRLRWFIRRSPQPTSCAATNQYGRTTRSVTVTVHYSRRGCSRPFAKTFGAPAGGGSFLSSSDGALDPPSKGYNKIDIGVGAERLREELAILNFPGVRVVLHPPRSSHRPSAAAWRAGASFWLSSYPTELRETHNGRRCGVPR